jgi:hypothetical protein
MSRTLVFTALLVFSALAYTSTQTTMIQKVPPEGGTQTPSRASTGTAVVELVVGNVPTGEGVSGYSVYAWNAQ